MGLFDNPFVPFPEFDWMRARLAFHFERGLVEAKRQEHELWRLRREEFFKKKPPGPHALYEAEEKVYDEDGPLKSSFNAEDVPAGVSYHEHLSAIPTLARRLSVEMYRKTGYEPRCGIVEFGAAQYLDALELRREAEPTFNQDYRSSVGKIGGRIDIHREPDCAGPYLIPRGELWLMLAWRYDFHRERRTEWARPVAIIQFEGLIEPAMMTIARCAR